MTTEKDADRVGAVQSEAAALAVLRAHDDACKQCSTLSPRGRCDVGEDLWWAFMRAPADPDTPDQRA